MCIRDRRRAEQALDATDATLIRRVFESYLYVSDLVEDKNTTIRRLRELFFGKRTEKTKAVVGRNAEKVEVPTSSEAAAVPAGGATDTAVSAADSQEADEADNLSACPGHGRNGADAYRGAERVEVPHPSLSAGDACPACGQGTVYAKPPGVLVRIIGQPPLGATIYELHKLRCHLCGEVLHNDDTTVKILELMGEHGRQEALASAAGDSTDIEQRTGLFTSGVVALRDGQRVALFFSGRRHAGENLAEVLKSRATGLPPPIQMCDALSRNLPGELHTIVAHCLAHARRQFVDVYDRFPEECGYLLEALAVVYRNDADARERQLSPEARLQFHQQASQPTMQQLHDWLRRQLDEKLTEPNSALGGAIGYMLRHWEKLTLFLRQAGAPLDNNVCERALKKAILHRKNALFYRTKNGARVGDLFMSLIYTCQLNEVNPFDYLTQLQEHADDLASSPERWMPWNYQAALA